MRTFQAPSLNLKSHFVIDLESTGEIRKDCSSIYIFMASARQNRRLLMP